MEHLNEALMEFHATEWVWWEVDKQAAAACKAHSRIVLKIRQVTE